GSMQSRSWTDQNGQKRYAWEVVADEISFVERKSGDSQQLGSSHDSYLPEPPAGYGTQPSAPSYQTPSSFSSNGASGSFEEISSDDELPF
ncbi:MAG: single-stranded DNA-binding protein, partial [Clostridia bacterium]|nr:single-stranded DNA-binding protein [Clostridia bacterium]